MLRKFYGVNDVNMVLNGEFWFTVDGNVGKKVDPQELYSNDDILIYLYINAIVHKEFVNLAKIGRYELTTENRMVDTVVVNTSGNIDMNFGIRENFVQSVYNFADKVTSEMVQTIGRDNAAKYTFPEIHVQIGDKLHIQTSTKIQVL